MTDFADRKSKHAGSAGSNPYEKPQKDRARLADYPMGSRLTLVDGRRVWVTSCLGGALFGRIGDSDLVELDHDAIVAECE